MVNLSWSKDLSKVTSIDGDKENSKDNMQFYIHKVIVDSTGKTYVIAEQYRKVISAGALVLNAALGNQNTDLSNIAIKIYNIVYMVFDKDFNIEKVELVKKKYSEFFLRKGQEFVTSTALAQIIKSSGNFDYEFTTVNKARTEFTVFYKDMNKKDEDNNKSDVVLGSISFKNNTIETKRTPINSDFSYIIFRNAGPSKILVGEFWKSKSKLYLRFENFE